MMIASASLQAYSASELGENCDTKLTTAPIIAAVSLFVSFIFNGIWVWSLYERHDGKWVSIRDRKKKTSAIRRVSILFWTAAVVVGTAAAGATLGQAELYKDMSCEVEISTGLHYVSIVLLIASIAWPHAMQKRHSEKNFEGVEGAPLKAIEPLRFL